MSQQQQPTAYAQPAPQPYSCRNVNWRLPQTWAILIGGFCSCSLIVNGLATLVGVWCNGVSVYAILSGILLLLLHLLPLFRCCTFASEETKFGKIARNNYVRGGIFLGASLLGEILNAAVCWTSTWLAVLWALGMVAGILYLLVSHIQKKMGLEDQKGTAQAYPTATTEGEAIPTAAYASPDPAAYPTATATATAPESPKATPIAVATAHV